MANAAFNPRGIQGGRIRAVGLRKSEKRKARVRGEGGVVRPCRWPSQRASRLAALLAAHLTEALFARLLANEEGHERHHG